MDTVQRAFELAASGDCRKIEELRTRLRREKFDNVDAHLAGGAIRHQLLAIIRATTLRRDRPVSLCSSLAKATR